ncbi:MAG TPA: fibronectin type III domain-containing protein [Candidatus Dormibacteraeota bacterium]|nr:fibronectin type III domain-containing protein [Candidatus Dormibacteraeota bacterium]
MGVKLGVVLAGCLLAASAGSGSSLSAAAAVASGPCQFQKADQPVNVAFCDTFDQPAGIGNRSGDLNGTVWGVSRLLGFVNYGQGQFYDASPTTMQKCGQTVTVQPPNDVAICNGQLVEAQNDQHSVTTIAMYPKQPFDIAGRTGTINFDVSDDSHGSHRAWPELWYTDQPVPAPLTHSGSLQEVPRNGFGVRFAGGCPSGTQVCHVNCPTYAVGVPAISVDSAVVVNNYVSKDSAADAAAISVKDVGCVKASSGPADMNHFEVRVGQNEVDVYGTDAGTTTPLKELAVISNMSLTLTRGLIWLEDVHYNGDKDGPDQGTHTFTWDNVGFDGPTLPRDLAFDVPDRLTPVGSNYPGLFNLGWPVTPTDPAPLTLSVPGVYNIANARAALLTFNYSTTNPVPVTYRINSGAWQDLAWPFGACYVQNNQVSCGPKTVAAPVPLTDVQPGTNVVQFKSSSEGIAVANVDLVLVGAAGGGSSPTPSPIATPTPTPRPTPSPTPTVGPPGQPTGVIETPNGTGDLTVSWTAPVSNGGAPITAYAVYLFSYSSMPKEYVTANSGTFEAAGLTPGAQYVAVAIAYNGQWGSWSNWSGWAAAP